MNGGEWVRQGAILVWRHHRCAGCQQHPAVSSNPDGLCDACTTALVFIAVRRITIDVLAALKPPTKTVCPSDGCLLIGDEPCPACVAQSLTHEEVA